ncbi:aminotransferase [Pseudomonas palleroniana]|uniref:Aminotransferase n=2 Tax=Gammaproteobacteria TaxID=1236 RepID=A0A1H5K0M6_9PSED|nr:aminotransferase [Pseudomonas palleroniana]KAB0563628.1 aminotransferase [Pseudomonas palleroniana]PTC22609.1 aminotransferase [Pseudomonas palleroniana]SEE58379.1 4-aminobutyrate aminotransferase [Pseudomonas palleroniana]
MLLATLIHRASLPCPQVSPDQAAQLLKQHYGLDGSLQSLGSQQDVNYKIDSERGRFVLKISRGDYAAIELQAQHAALKDLQGREHLRVPKVIQSLKGDELLTVSLDDQTLHLRLLEYIDGRPLTDLPHLSSEVIQGFGALCGRMSQALAGFEHPGLERTLQWDPRHAQELITHLLTTLQDLPQRAALAQVARQVEAYVKPLAQRLPWQAVHMDITDDNVVWQRDAQRHWQCQGVIDFGDLVHTWRIADLSVTCAALLHHAEGDPFAILPAIQACHAITPLQREELQVLWPLIVARAAVLVLSSEQQQRLDPDNAYLLKNAEHEWEIFHVATSVPFELMEAAIFRCVGDTLPTIAEQDFAPLLPGLVGREFALIDLGVLSPHFEAGNWEVPGIDQRLLDEAAAVHGLAASRYGQYRLSRTRPDSAAEPETFALHVELHLPHGSVVQAPFAGTLHAGADGLVCLQGAPLSLRLWGVKSQLTPGSALVKGQVLGQVQAPLTVQLCRAELEPPLFCTPSRAPAWQALCPSPATLLGLACDAEPELDPEALLARRDASFARSQKHYYVDPPRIERGWRNHLIDMQGRSYLDMLNNVAVLGHGHPRMAAVAARQWSLLNTNSRFHYAAIAEFSERLLALAPDGMDRVFLVNSGTEANDLAIRLAWAYSGGRDMLSVLEAYHGWSVAADAVSTSIADNPQALSSRPDWVHPVTAPNTYRGEFRGPDSAPDYVRSVEHSLAKIAASKRQLAGFICEPVYGNAGGISLPPGYLQQVYGLVRAQGGVCIADEVQVGYGRMGHFFWGFEEQGVVPDIITMAKGMGNGQPLGAVITRREIAEALEAEGYFFSSAGGSPVSCRIGMAVLDVMEEEKLWENAQVVGGHFKARLEALIDRHPLVGAVHGSGFYLGLELVRDRHTLEPATFETALLCDRLRELGIFMQPTGDYLNILKIKPPMVTSRRSVDFFVDMLSKVLDEQL